MKQNMSETGDVPKVDASAPLGVATRIVPSHPDTDNATLAFHLPPGTAVQDLSTDALLTAAGRIAFSGTQVPSLGGIPLLYKLGQGGMGAVYFGIHPRLKSEVAVKVLPFQMASQQPDLVQRFYREAQIAAKVKSPHLVGVMDVNEEKGLFYLVMEYVNGVSAGGHVRTVRKAGRPGLDEITALDICIAASEGLAHAHNSGIIHRDIKPDNILIPKDKSGSLCFSAAKVADLGLARADDGDSSLTAVASTMGTPGFMAPEQADDAKKAGKPSDVFSMGGTLYAMLCGQAPFHESTSLATILASIQKPHTPLTQHRADISALTGDLIDRCLSKESAARYGDAGALLEGLKNCRAALDPSVQPGPLYASKVPLKTQIASQTDQREALHAPSSIVARPLVQPVTPRLFQTPERRSRMPLIAAAAAVPALVLIAYFAFRSHPKPDEPASPISTPNLTASPAIEPPKQDDDSKKLVAAAEDRARLAQIEQQKAEAARAQAEQELQQQRLNNEKTKLEDQKRADEAAKLAAVDAAKRDARLQVLREEGNTQNLALKSANQKISTVETALASAQEQEKKTAAVLATANAALADAQKSERDTQNEMTKRQEDERTADNVYKKVEGNHLRPQQLQMAKDRMDAATKRSAEATTAHNKAANELQKLQSAQAKALQNSTAAMTQRTRADEDLRMAKQSAADANAALKKTLDEINKLNPPNAPQGDAPPAPMPAQSNKPAPAVSVPGEQMKGAYKLFSGPYDVVESAASITDTERKKELPVKLYYPQSDEKAPFPIVIFSHGFLASRDNYNELGKYWASHGYVCIYPSHADSLSLKKDGGIANVLEHLDPYKDPKALEDRFRDISFIIDSLDELKTKAPALRNKMDVTRVGVGGHSLGAYTAQALGGATLNLSGIDKHNFADRRVRAIVLMSAQGAGEGGLAQTSWQNFKLPMLNISGSLDKGLKGQDVSWRKEPYAQSSPGDKYQLFMDGAHHGLGGIAASGAASAGPGARLLEALLGPDNATQRDWVKTSSLAFWDAYLKDDTTAKAYLKSDELQKLGNGKLTFEKK